MTQADDTPRQAAGEQLGLFDLEAPEPPPSPALPETDPDRAAHRVGERHEQVLELAGQRKAAGAYYTPPDVVLHLLDLTLTPILDACGDSIERVRALRVLDPAAGTGNFLSAAGDLIRRRLEDVGVPTADACAIAYGQCLVGVDLDPAAVELCVASLVHASRDTVTPEAMSTRVVCADAFELLSDGDDLFAADSGRCLAKEVGAVDGFDLVIGNPPFLSQLASETVRAEADTARLRRRFGPAVGSLTDTAALFLLLAVDAAKPVDGVACLIQPMSVLSTKDGAAARNAVLQQSSMRAAWICEEQVFDASVRVCAPVFVRGHATESVELVLNRAFEPAGSVPFSELQAPTWSALLAASKGVPRRALRTGGSVRDIAAATADFRDQYYGLRGCVVDAADGDDSELPPLVTSGLLDPAQVLWGERATKFDKTRYEHPRVNLSQLTPKLQQWARSRLRPKIMLATQTKVLEAFVDESGRYLPSVPVLTITTDQIEDLWRLGALLSSAPVTLVAANRHLGAALSSEALKLSASDVLELPLPSERAPWDKAADHFKQATLADADARSRELAISSQLICEAFGLEDDAELMTWWSGRLPARSAAR